MQDMPYVKPVLLIVFHALQMNKIATNVNHLHSEIQLKNVYAKMVILEQILFVSPANILVSNVIYKAIDVHLAQLDVYLMVIYVNVILDIMKLLPKIVKAARILVLHVSPFLHFAIVVLQDTINP